MARPLPPSSDLCRRRGRHRTGRPDPPRPCAGDARQPRDAAGRLTSTCPGVGRLLGVAARGPGAGPRPGRGEGAGTPLADAVPQAVAGSRGGVRGKPPGGTFYVDWLGCSATGSSEEEPADAAASRLQGRSAPGGRGTSPSPPPTGRTFVAGWWEGGSRPALTCSSSAASPASKVGGGRAGHTPPVPVSAAEP